MDVYSKFENEAMERFSVLSIESALNHCKNEKRLMERLITLKNEGVNLHYVNQNPWAYEMRSAKINDKYIEIAERISGQNAGRRAETVFQFRQRRLCSGKSKSVKIKEE